MAESEFSWFKIVSFIGTLLLVVVAFIAFAAGIGLITAGDGVHGVATILGGVISVALAVIIYRNYQQKSRNH